MPKTPAKKKLGKSQMKKSRGGSAFDAFLEVPGIQGETELKPGTPRTPSNTLEYRNWKL